MITKKNLIGFMFTVFSSMLLFAGCDDAGEDDSKSPSYDLEIAGTWSSNWSSTETITDSDFITQGEGWGMVYSVISHDNEANSLFYQDIDAESGNYNKYGRIVWTDITESGDIESFYYCTEVAGENTLADAQSNPTTSDSSDPATGGCGGYSWTRLSAAANN